MILDNIGHYVTCHKINRTNHPLQKNDPNIKMLINRKPIMILVIRADEEAMSIHHRGTLQVWSWLSFSFSKNPSLNGQRVWIRLNTCHLSVWTQRAWNNETWYQLTVRYLIAKHNTHARQRYSIDIKGKAILFLKNRTESRKLYWLPWKWC